MCSPAEEREKLAFPTRCPTTHSIRHPSPKQYRSRGMERSCVILDDAIMRIQFMRLARQSGIFKYERYIDASAHKHWLAKARNWVSHGIDPAQ